METGIAKLVFASLLFSALTLATVVRMAKDASLSTTGWHLEREVVPETSSKRELACHTRGRELSMGEGTNYMKSSLGEGTG